MPPFVHTVLCLAIVAIAIKPLGKYVARIFMGKNTFMNRMLGWLERLVYRACGIKADEEMNWTRYACSMLIFGFFGFALLYIILICQHFLPLNPQGFPGIQPSLAFNIAIGFIANGNWQSYSGENALSNFSQTSGLAVQNFVSTATGMTVFAALARGISRKQVKNIGNFYVDVVRGTIYILLPLSLVFAILMVSQGVVQNMGGYVAYSPLESREAEPDSRPALIPQGAVASQVAVKTIGSGGGGFFGANTAHPFENPTPLSNLIQIIAIMLLPASLAYGFGYMIGDRRQGWALIATMSLIFLPSLILTTVIEQDANPLFNSEIIDSSAGNMEGKEARFDITSTALRAVAATATSNGSPNYMLDSFYPLGALAPIILTQFSEVIFGGVGSGIYNILAFVILTVFIGGLMTGRAPEYMGKKITTFDIKMASVIVIIPAIIVLGGTAIAVSTEAGKAGVLNVGAQGFTEILYAFSSAGNNDGGSFAGLKTDTAFYNVALAVAMFFGRYLVIIAAIAIAGSFAGKNISPVSAGTLPTHTPIFIFLLSWVLIIVGILTYVPAIVFGPVAEHFHLQGLATSNMTVIK